MHTTRYNIDHYTLNFSTGRELIKFRNFSRQRKNVHFYRKARGSYQVFIISDSAEHLMFAMLFPQRKHDKTSAVTSTSA
jgi:hypothetical protein